MTLAPHNQVTLDRITGIMPDMGGCFLPDCHLGICRRTRAVGLYLAACGASRRIDDSEGPLLHGEREQERSTGEKHEESKNDKDDPHPATSEFRTDSGKEQDGGEKHRCQNVVVSGLICFNCDRS